MNSKVVFLRCICVFLLGMMSLSTMGMYSYSEIYPSEIQHLQNGLSGSNSLTSYTSTVNVTFLDPVQRNPLRHYLLPPKFEVTIENSSVITGFRVGLRSNETDHEITRIYLSPELEGVILMSLWNEIEDGVIEMIVEVRTAEDTATDSVWIIKDLFGDFLSRYWIYIVLGVVLSISVVIVTNYAMKKRIKSKMHKSENL